MVEYKVFVTVDSKSRITAIDSSAFLPAIDGWIEIDGGYGDKYHHAQGNYFEKPLTDDRGIYRYVTVPADEYPNKEAIHTYYRDGVLYGIYERTQEEMDADWIEPEPAPSQEDRVAGIERAVNSLLGGVLDTQT